MLSEDPILVRDMIAVLSQFPGDCEVSIHGDILQEVEIRIYEPGTINGIDIYQTGKGLMV